MLNYVTYQQKFSDENRKQMDGYQFQYEKIYTLYIKTKNSTETTQTQPLHEQILLKRISSTSKRTIKPSKKHYQPKVYFNFITTRKDNPYTYIYIMGNQESLGQKRAVYQDEGKYIIPTKVKIPQSAEETQIVKNIFGINDPTLLTKSYWAKEKNIERPYEHQINETSPLKSQRFNQSTIRLNNDAEIQRTEFFGGLERQLFVKSTVTNFKDDCPQYPSRNLSKMTSCSIIAKLKQFQEDNQSVSPSRASKFTKNLKNSSYSKNKQNHNHLCQSRKISQKKLSKSQFKQNSILKNKKQSPLKETRKRILEETSLDNQINNIFGLSNIRQNRNDTSRVLQDHTNIRKTQAQLTQRNECFHDIEKPCENYRQNQKDISEQTFSRYEQNSVLIKCPSVSNKSSQKVNNKQKSVYSDKISQNSKSKNYEIQKYEGLNEDSHNESFLKVFKKVNQISIDQTSQNKSLNAVQILSIQESTSQIFNENLNKQDFLQKSSYVQSNKRVQSDEDKPFQFDVKKVQNSQRSRESFQKSSKKAKTSQNIVFDKEPTYHDHKYSQAGRSLSKGQSKVSIHHLTDHYQEKKRFLQNYQASRNDLLDNEESQAFDEKSSHDSLKFQKIKSPKSIASQAVRLTRQKSCAGRVVQTSKAGDNKRSSPFKSKKYDFNKKYQAISCSPQHYPDPSSHLSSYQNSNKTTIDQRLMLKIQTLEEELDRLKYKQELAKFESRRYSPVKQEKLGRKVQRQEDYQQQNEQSIDPKFSINEFSKSTPFKHRSQYFKLKLK